MSDNVVNETDTSDDWAAAMAEQQQAEATTPAPRAPNAVFEQFSAQPAKPAAICVAADLSPSVTEMNTVPPGGSPAPAAACALPKAVG